MPFGIRRFLTLCAFEHSSPAGRGSQLEVPDPAAYRFAKYLFAPLVSHSIASAFQPYTKFLFIGPTFCRRLPSDSVSRRTPLPLAVTFPLSGRFGDLHPLEYVRAGRTTKAPWSESRGPDRFRSQSRRLRLTATGRGSGHALGAATLHPQSGDFAFTRDAFRGNVCLYG